MSVRLCVCVLADASLCMIYCTINSSKYALVAQYFAIYGRVFCKSHFYVAIVVFVVVVVPVASLCCLSGRICVVAYLRSGWATIFACQRRKCAFYVPTTIIILYTYTGI